jgi:uncharacterized RDD family membrane protein YckC
VTDIVVAPARAHGLEGHYAGVVTRLCAFVVDVLVIGLLFTLGGAVFEYVASRLTGDDVNLSDAPIVSGIALGVWAFVYFAYPLATAGHTLGMAMLGLRVTRADGGDLDGTRAVVRTLALPLSFLVLGLGFLLILVRRDRRALHDLIGRTSVVYAWDARAAHLRFLAKRPATRP